MYREDGDDSESEWIMVDFAGVTLLAVPSTIES